MPNHPLVSIIIPTYNRAHLIGETLDSVLAQTYTNWECIVVDDGSTDGTEDVIHSYLEKDRRFYFYHRPKNRVKGANACRNFGLENSKGEYVNFFDSDDTMHPDKLSIQVKALQNDLEAPFCICQTKWIDKKTNEFLGLRSKQIISDQPLEDYILYKIFWTTIAPLWRKKFITQHDLLFDETLRQSQEYDFHIKALAINDKYVSVGDELSTLYRHDTSISHNLYESIEKLESNIIVKERILINHRHKISAAGLIKFYEILTIMFKQLLQYGHFGLAHRLLKLHLRYIGSIELPASKKLIFMMRLNIMFFSYRLFNRGYHIVKPLK